MRGITVLNRYYVFCLWAFLSLSDAEFNLLTFREGFETVRLNGAEMNKYVRTVFLLYESKTFGVVKKLNRSCDSRHYMYYLY